MATSVVFPRVQFFANNGRPLIGGRIHTYLAGTSRRAPTFKDAANTQPNDNPIILDGRGEASIYLLDGVEYKFVVEDSKGALILTQEPVYGALWPFNGEMPGYVTLTYQYMLEAKEARDDAIAAAGAIGPLKFYDTYALAVAALPTLPEGTLVEVARDETRDGARTRYRVASGAYVFVVNLDQLRIDLKADTGSGRVGYGKDTVKSALDRLLKSDIRQHLAADLLLGSAEEGTALYPGAGNALQGIVILDTPGGTRIYASQAVSGTSETSSERGRLIEFAFSETGGGITPIAYSPELEIGHGQDLGGYVDDTNRVILYTSAQPAVGGPYGKGVSRIIWKGTGTTQADVATYTLFSSTAGQTRADYEARAFGLSEDGSRIVINARRSIDNSATLIAFDRAAVEAAADPLTVSPILEVVIDGEPTSINSTLQGICADKYAIYMLYGFTAALGRQSITAYNWAGESLKSIDVDSSRADYGYAKLLGDATLGHPVAQEPEGITVYQGRLFISINDVWTTTNNIVSYLGSNYACINDCTGIYPHNTGYWVQTTFAAGGAFNPETAYTRGVRTRRRKLLYSFEDLGAGVAGSKPITGNLPIAKAGGALNLRPNTSDTTYAYGQAYAVRRWAESLRRYFPAMEITGNGFLNLYDTTIGADEANWGGMRAVKNGGRQYTSFFGNNGTASGFTLNLYGTADSVYAGGSARLFNPAGTAVVTTDPDGQTAFLSQLSTKAAVVAQAQAADTDAVLIRYGSTIRGSIQAGSTSTRFVARNGHGLLFATSAAAADTPIDYWRVAQDGVWHPVTDGVTNIARASLRVNNSYFAVAPTVGSDANLKQGRRGFSDAERAAAKDLKALGIFYKLNDAVALKGFDGARWHAGVFAQEVVAVLEKHELDWRQYGFVGHDEWGDEYVDHDPVYEPSLILGPNEEPLQVEVKPAWREKVRDAGDRYSIRYEELTWFVLCAADL